MIFILRILKKGAPMGIVINEFEQELKQVKGVMDIHDLHIWSLSVGKPALSAHVFSSEPGTTLREATKLCRRLSILDS